MAKTHAEDRDVVAQSPDQLDGDARVGWVPGTGRDDDQLRVEADDLLDGHLVIAVHDTVGAEMSHVLHEVVDERVVVVDDADHAAAPSTVTPRARAPEPSFARHSAYSAAGSESCTMPPPACRRISPSDRTMLRMVRYKSTWDSPNEPTAPEYSQRRLGSRSSMISIARTLGVPVMVPAGNVARMSSSVPRSPRVWPRTSEVRC